MSDGTPRLCGRWALARTGGLLPPLGALNKRIVGDRGATRLGALPLLPFRVRPGPRGPQLEYPLGILRDDLEPAGDGGWDGETRLLGVRVGRFRMTPDRQAGPRGPERVQG